MDPSGRSSKRSTHSTVGPATPPRRGRGGPTGARTRRPSLADRAPARAHQTLGSARVVRPRAARCPRLLLDLVSWFAQDRMIPDSPPDYVRLTRKLFGSVAEGCAPSGAKLSSHTPIDASTRLTRSCGGNAGGFARSASMKSGSAARKARCSSRESLRTRRPRTREPA